MSDSEQLLKANQHIGVAAIGVPDGCTFFTELVLIGALKALLRRGGVEWLEWTASCQPDVVVQIITVRDRGPVLRAVHDALDEIGILGICQIAYVDWDEMYWRTVHPLGASPFNRFLDRDKIATASREFEAWREAFRELQRRQNPPEGNPQA